VRNHPNAITGSLIRDLAAECGFDLAGVAAAFPTPDFARFSDWKNRGLAGEMRYLTDHRADIRNDPAHLLPGVRTIISTAVVYSGPEPYSTAGAKITTPCFAQNLSYYAAN
jgi:epoxyqueuosine reductase